MTHLGKTPLEALRDDRGGMTLWMLLWVIGIMAMGGFAVDTSKAWRMKTMLRAAADASSHAAVQAVMAGDDPVATAQHYAQLNLPPESVGEVLRPADVELGGWNAETGAFVAGDPAGNAVQVTVYRATRNANAEPTTLLRIIGVDKWDLSMRSVASVYSAIVVDPDLEDSCLTKGIVSRKTVGVTSNNTFSDVCVHGEEGFTFNNNNVYEDGTEISMPQLWPLLNHGKHINAKKNRGLYESLVERSMDPPLVDKTDDLTLHFAKGADVMTVNEFGPGDLVPGAHIYVHCASQGRVTLPSGRVENVVLTTNCEIKFSNKSEFVNSVIATSMNGGIDDHVFQAFNDQSVMTAAMAGALLQAGRDAATGNPVTAVTGASSVSLGEPDGCTDGGGSMLIADGDIRTAAKMGIFGSTVIASGEVQMAAQALGVEGMSIQAGGDVDLPAQQTFIGCNGSDWRIAVKQKVRFMN